MTDLIFSARKAPKHADPLHNLRHVTETEAGVFVPMYCKDKVYCGIEEFSFEELRALRWKAKKRALEDRRRKEEERVIAGKTPVCVRRAGTVESCYYVISVITFETQNTKPFPI